MLVPDSAWKSELRKEVSGSLHKFFFLSEHLRLFLTQDPELYSHWAKPYVAVFCSEVKPILRSRSEHAIWFGRTSNNKVVYKCSSQGL